MYEISCKFPTQVTPKLSRFIATKLLSVEDTLEVNDAFIEKCAMHMLSSGVLKPIHLVIQQIPKSKIKEGSENNVGVKTKHLEHKNVFVCRIRSAIGDLKSMGFVEYSDKILIRNHPVEEYEKIRKQWLEAKDNKIKPKFNQSTESLDEEEKARFAEWLKFQKIHDATSSS